MGAALCGWTADRPGPGSIEVRSQPLSLCQPPSTSSLLPPPSSSSPSFAGCLRGLLLDGEIVPLHNSSYQTRVEYSGCPAEVKGQGV